MKTEPLPAPSQLGRISAGFSLAGFWQGNKDTLLVVVVAVAAIALLAWFVRRRRQEPDSLLPTALSADPPGADFGSTLAEGEAAARPERRPTPSPGLHGRIEVSVGGQTISTFLVTDNPLPIGRDPGQALVIIQEPIVSKLHCQIFHRGGAVFVKDLQSTNGVYVNEAKVEEQRLEDGDVIYLGKKGTVRILYRR